MTYLSFQANNANLNPAELHLSTPMSKEVSGEGKSYRQFINYHGMKVVLLTPNFQLESLKMRSHKGVQSALIPVESWLREQLNILERFVVDNVSIPEDVPKPTGIQTLYKSLWGSKNMYITLSKWCNFFQFKEGSGGYEPLTSSSNFGRGTYNVSIEVPYVYIGPHKDGHCYSLTLRIVQVVYKPDLIPSTPSPVTQSITDTPKVRRQRKRASDVPIQLAPKI